MQKYVVGTISSSFNDALGRTFEIPADEGKMWRCVMGLMKDNNESALDIDNAYHVFVHGAGSVYSTTTCTYFVGVLEEF